MPDVCIVRIRRAHHYISCLVDDTISAVGKFNLRIAILKLEGIRELRLNHHFAACIAVAV